MIYKETRPCKELQPYINCFWTIENSEEVELSDISFPDGCIEIIFNLGTSMHTLSENNQFVKNPVIEIIGQLTQPYIIQSNGKIYLLGVRFYPHTAACFIRENLKLLNNKIINGEDILGSDVSTLYQKILNERDKKNQITYLQDFFKTIFTVQHKLFSVAEYAVKKILFQKEKADLQSIASDCGITQRYLQLAFNECVAISPNMLIKIIRFQKTFKYLEKKNGSLTSIAYDCDYFDQSHFIRDFKTFTGNTPSKYILQEHPLNNFFLSANNISYLYNFMN